MILQLISKLKKEFSFIQGNYLILVLSWILMDFAMELPGTYYPRYVRARVALGMLTGGFLYEHVNPQLPFSLLLVFLIPQLLVTIFLVHEPEKRED